MGRRIEWIDYARGLAILGVVVWHVVGGVVGSGIPTTDAMVAFGDLWDLYTFRLMPIFFFVSGAFFVRAMSRPFMDVLVNKLRTIMYPYFLWSVVMLVVGTLTARFRNGGDNLGDLLRLFYDPILHFWFLYALFVIMILTYAAYAAKINRWLIAAFTVIIFILSAATLFYNVWYVVGQIGYFAVYFIAGVWVGSDFMKTVDQTSLPIHVGMFVLGAIALIFIPITGMNQTALNWQPLAATIVMLMTINLSVVLARFQVLSVIRYWGELSLEIYLVHVLAFSSFRIVMYNLFNVENAWFHIIAGIIVGLYVPIAIKWVSDKVGTDLLFTAPEIKRPVQTSPAGAD